MKRLNETLKPDFFRLSSVKAKRVCIDIGILKRFFLLLCCTADIRISAVGPAVRALGADLMLSIGYYGFV
jgi:hypothetical protein